MVLKRLPLKGMHNLRDLGGYPAGNGKATKWKQFFRADGLFGLEQSDIDFILDYCMIKTVIDLRGVSELKWHPNSFAKIDGVRLENVPLVEFDNYFAEWVTLERGYISVAKLSKNMIKRVFDVIADSLPAPVLYHCTAGKDRTGILSCLILGACGVDNFDIAGDYEVSSTYIRRDLVKVVDPGEEPNMDYIVSPSEAIYSFIDYITKEHGSIEGFLRDCGVESKTLNKLKGHFVVDITCD